MGAPLFESSASTYASKLDKAIHEGRFRRGELITELARSEVPEGSLVLDYGCGSGHISCLLSRNGYEVEGVDPSEKMIEEAKKNAEGLQSVTFRRISSTDEIASGRYDGIICSSVIEYVEDDAGLLRAFYSWVKPKGVVIISFANRRSLWRRYAKLRFGRSAPHYEIQLHTHTAKEFAALAHKAGFITLQATSYFDSPFDYLPYLGWVGESSLLGALGLVILKRL